MHTESFQLRPLPASQLPAAAVICARAMGDNPIHIRVFGSNQPRRLQRLQRFFPSLLDYLARKGELYGAFHHDQLIGVLGMLPPGRCQPGLRDILRLLPGLLRASSPFSLLRTLYWLASWARLDPATPHWHLGPLAVDPQWQGHGAGRQLITFACQHCLGATLYLETDKPANVSLYQSFGFAVCAEVRLLGSTCWLMTRPPQNALPTA